MNCRGRQSPENGRNESEAPRATQFIGFCTAAPGYGLRFVFTVGLRRRQFLYRPPGYSNDAEAQLQNWRFELVIVQKWYCPANQRADQRVNCRRILQQDSAGTPAPNQTTALIIATNSIISDCKGHKLISCFGTQFSCPAGSDQDELFSSGGIGCRCGIATSGQLGFP